MKTFNFNENKIQTLDLETLRATYKENDVYGNPLKDIYHYQVINNILETCKANGLRYDIQDMFAANNNSKQYPGVSILPQVATIYGENSPESHILRRVYTTIAIHDGEDDELNTNIAIAYHQDGLQVAFGTTVKICHNLCILGADKMITNYGKSGKSNEEVFQTIDDWLRNFGNHQARDLEFIRKMRQIEVTKADAMRLIGTLTVIRVSFDNSIGEVRQNLNAYPLNQAQISTFTESYLRFEQENENVTLWDVYNLATHIYKPATTEIPNILPQTAVLFEVLNENFNLSEA